MTIPTPGVQRKTQQINDKHTRLGYAELCEKQARRPWLFAEVRLAVAKAAIRRNDKRAEDKRYGRKKGGYAAD